LQVDIENRESIRVSIKPSARLTRGIAAGESYSLRSANHAKSGSFRLEASSWQINLVQEAMPFINERGSFTLVSAFQRRTIFASAAAATVSGALEGFCSGCAVELPKGLRINV